MLEEGDNCDGRPADTLLSIFLFFLFFFSCTVTKGFMHARQEELTWCRDGG
jgi:hypothetical protein